MTLDDKGSLYCSGWRGGGNSVTKDCLCDCLSALSKFNFTIVFCHWFIEWHTLCIAVQRIAFTGTCADKQFGDLSNIVCEEISDLCCTRI